MESQSSPPCPNMLTVRRNPHRRARPTPSANAIPRPPSNLIASEIPSFPTEEILAMQVPRTLSISPIENLKVFLRIRPLTIQGSGKRGTRGNQSSKSVAKNAWLQNPSAKIEIQNKSSQGCIAVNDTQSVTLSPPSDLKDVKRIKSEVYEGFSHVFCADSSQEEVYETMVNPLVEDFISGKSGMLAALGPSGSGKTHTVFGCPRKPGMVPLALKQIFKRTEGSDTEATRLFYISMFEICSERGKGERLLDLSPGGTDLSMQQSSIKGLQEVIISNAAQAESLIDQAMLKRSTAMTNSNSQSSRSQCIINIRSAPKNLERDIDVQLNSSVLTIVDLAGAEREKRTGNQGARLVESNFINNTSMVFGLCLRSLLEHQRNPKKPLQKHFQNSLLTRYLRDYLEGKKRMALILTIMPGEEDYLDTSFLLKQASPYMKIKFNNVEELPDLVSKKRHVKTLPRLEKCKRMKFSNLDASSMEGDSVRDQRVLCGSDKEVNPGQLKETGTVQVLVQSPRKAHSDANGSTLLNLNNVDLAKRERNNQIMQGFAKALWNVLKQYKEKLEEAENQVQSLRESIKSEKAKYFELDKEMKDLKSHCSCCKEKIVETTLTSENPISKLIVDDSSQLEGQGSITVDEIDMNVSLSLDIEAFKHGYTPKKCDGSVQQEFGASLQILLVPPQMPKDVAVIPECEEEINSCSRHLLEPQQMSKEEDVATREVCYIGDVGESEAEVHSCSKPVLDPQLTPKEDVTVMQESEAEVNSCSKSLMQPQLISEEDVSTREVCYIGDLGEESEAEVHSCGKPVLDPQLMSREDVTAMQESEAKVNYCCKCLMEPKLMSEEEDIATRELCCIGAVGETEAEVNSCSKPVLDPQLMSKEDVTAMQESEAEVYSCSKCLMEPQLIYEEEDVATREVCYIGDVGENEAEVNSCSKPVLEFQLMSKEDATVTQESEAEVNSCSKCLMEPQLLSEEGDVATREVRYIGDVGESEAAVHSRGEPVFDHQLTSKKDVIVMQVCDTDDATENEAELNSCSKLFLAPPLMPKEDAIVIQICDTDNLTVSEADISSCRKAFKAEKPRRRLLPASSILLKDMGGLGLEDENRKSKGTKGGKKLAGDDINRTQGSISLLRLLKSNLRL